MVTTDVSVLRVAKPSPGKCFIEGMTPVDSRPVANASDRAAVWTALNDQVRPSRYRNDSVVAGTSATGAKSTLMPRALSAAPVLAPCDRATVVLSSTPICGADRVGGAHGIRLTEPPSWSVAIRSGGWPPAFAAAWSVAVSLVSWVREVTLDPNRIRPPIWPRRIRDSRLALGVVPSMRMTSFCPTRRASVGAATVAVCRVGAAAAVAGAAVVAAPATVDPLTALEQPMIRIATRSAAPKRRVISAPTAASRCQPAIPGRCTAGPSHRSARAAWPRSGPHR